MTDIQLNLLLETYALSPSTDNWKEKLSNFGVNPDETLEIEELSSKLNYLYNQGLCVLSRSQFTRLSEIVKNDGYVEERIQRQLRVVFDIEEEYHPAIHDFYRKYSLMHKEIFVNDLCSGFTGVQVVTADNFNTLITQGFSGDWVLNPENVPGNYLQIASFSDSGLHPRGYYIIAIITDFMLVPNSDPKRYRIFFRDAQIIDTGNRNIRFNSNPVSLLR